MKKLSPLYIAGLFDGEGYFIMNRARVSRKNSVRPWRYQCYAFITMRDGWLLKEITKTLGAGHFSNYKRRAPQHADYFNVMFQGDELRKFLKVIGPHLLIKHEQAIVVGEICNMKAKTGNRPISDSFYKRQCELYSKIRKLNKRGRKS